MSGLIHMKPDVPVKSLFSTEYDKDLTTKAVKMLITSQSVQSSGRIKPPPFLLRSYTVIHTSNLFITVQDKEFIAKAVCWPVNYADITKVYSDAITENFVVENTRSRLITEEPLKKVDE